MQVSSLIVAAALTVFGPQDASVAPQSSPVVLHDCQVTLIYDNDVPADLPAVQGGVLKEIGVKAGDSVAAGTILATIDDTLEVVSEKVALQRLEMAEEEANNDINVRYAKTAADVYEYKFRQAYEAHLQVPDAYTNTQLTELRLQWKQYELQTEQATHERKLAFMSVGVRKEEHELAKHELNRRQVKAPVDGIIVEVYPKLGGWVRSGDPIVRLVQLDKLRIKGFVKYSQFSPADVEGRTVTVSVPYVLDQNGRAKKFTGTIDHASHLLEGGDGFTIRAEVTNVKHANGKHYLLMPGMTADMVIQM